MTTVVKAHRFSAKRLYAAGGGAGSINNVVIPLNLVSGDGTIIVTPEIGQVDLKAAPFMFAENSVFSATTATSPVTFLTLTTPYIPAGTYLAMWEALVSVGANNDSGFLRVRLDGTTDIINPGATDGAAGAARIVNTRVINAPTDDHGVWSRIPAAGFRQIAIASPGIHALALQYWAGSGSFGVHYGALSMRRVF